MKITEDKFSEILKSNHFDGLDIEFMIGDLFKDKVEVDVKDALECVLKDAMDSLNKEYDLRASGDIAYIIEYLERYKAAAVELEGMK